MKAISLHAPWGTLLAIGTKKWETRSWPCPPSIIGQRVAIHQAKRKPAPDDPERWGYEDGCGFFDLGLDVQVVGRPATGDVPHMYVRADRHNLPLGCIVASGVITRSLPIVGPNDARPETAIRAGRMRLGVPAGESLQAGLWLHEGTYDPSVTDISDQLPFGNWAPGRYAWELSDVAAVTDRCPWCWGRCVINIRATSEMSVEALQSGALIEGDRCPVCDANGKCDPIPAKGKQGFWNWQAEIPPRP